MIVFVPKFKKFTAKITFITIYSKTNAQKNPTINVTQNYFPTL